MTVRDIAVAFGFDVDQRSVNNVENTINNLKSYAGKALSLIGVGFSIHGLSQLAEAAANVDALKSQFSQVFGEAEQAADAALNKVADETGVVANRIKGSFVQIGAFAKTTGMDEAEALELSERAMMAVADSAAFYDRSIEQVTASMQSYLKGNYANDAALGISSTEYTRNAAAMELYGKKFTELAENQKQLTLLKMVEDGNKASGALGQAARETDQWGNQLGNLKQSLKDLKVALGNGILKPAIQVVKILSQQLQGITKQVKKITDEGGFLEREWNRIRSLFKVFQPLANRTMQSLKKGMGDARDKVMGFMDKLGGTENVLRLLTAVVVSFFAVFAFNKIISGIKMVGKFLSALKSPMFPIVAIVTIIVLLVEDFINYLNGNDSVIGVIFDKLGISLEDVKGKMAQVKTFFINAWNIIKAVAGTVGGFLIDTWKKISSFMVSVFGGSGEKLKGIWQELKGIAISVFTLIKTVVITVITSMKERVQHIFETISSFWDKWGTQITSYFRNVWNAILTIVQGFLEVIRGVIDFVTSVFVGDWSGAWEAVKTIFSGVWEMIVGILTGVWETIKLLFTAGIDAIRTVWSEIWSWVVDKVTSVWNGILSFLQAIWEGIISGITSVFSSIKDKVVSGLEPALDWIKNLGKEALTWGSDIINGIVEGIKGGIGRIGEAASEIGGKIKSFLHFSVPDEGPLTDFHSWMPDFMAGLSIDLEKNKGPLLDQVKSIASDISTFMRAATASAATTAASSISNKTTSVTQSVQINNSFSGGSAEVQRNTARAARKSATDATTQMARGLAYARG